jgi:serine/threonine protein kinase
MFNFRPERVNTKQKLGEGGYGAVYPYQKNKEDDADTKWVVKHMSIQNPKKVCWALQEITLGFNCDNPHILPISGFHCDENNGQWEIYLKVPRMKSSLKDVLVDHTKNSKPIPEGQIAQYFYDIVQGLQYLHGKKIAHRDIKPDNILLDKDGKSKIADFGLVYFHGSDTTDNLVRSKAGTPAYLAPELKYATKELKQSELFNTDLWSLGITLFELCTFSKPDPTQPLSSQKNIENNIIKKLQETGKDYSQTLITLISKLLRYEPSERISLKDIEKELADKYKAHLVIT